MIAKETQGKIEFKRVMTFVFVNLIKKNINNRYGNHEKNPLFVIKN